MHHVVAFWQVGYAAPVASLLKAQVLSRNPDALIQYLLFTTELVQLLGIVQYGYNAVDFVAPPSQLDQHVVLSRPTVRGDVNTVIGSGLIVSSLVTASCF